MNRLLQLVENMPFPSMEGELNDIAHANMQSVAISEFPKEEELRGAILAMLERIKDAYKTKATCNYLFYCWFDDLAGELRFSLVPDVGVIPFAGPVVVADGLEEIVDLALIDRTGYVLEEYQESEDAPFDDELPPLKVFFEKYRNTEIDGAKLEWA
ncbi:MAG: hypothetical protein RPU41_03790 [Candidatus Sedimenticola sp. (ex Thyasira tokunagai)]